jgi:hypothetical protein
MTVTVTVGQCARLYGVRHPLSCEKWSGIHCGVQKSTRRGMQGLNLQSGMHRQQQGLATHIDDGIRSSNQRTTDMTNHDPLIIEGDSAWHGFGTETCYRLRNDTAFDIHSRKGCERREASALHREQPSRRVGFLSWL